MDGVAGGQGRGGGVGGRGSEQLFSFEKRTSLKIKSCD